MAFDDSRFRGGLAKRFTRMRLTAADSQLQLGDGCVLSSTNTANRTITFPDETGTVALLGDLVSNQTAATTTTLGSVIVPTAGRLAVDGSGNISVPLATGAVFGVVEVTAGNGLALASGVVSQSLSTTTTAGTVIVPTAGHLSVDGSGNVSVNAADVPLLAAATNAFTGIVSMTAARPASVSPTMSGATITLDPTLGNSFLLLGVSSVQAAQTVNLSASPPAGQFIFIMAKASASGTVTYTYGTHFKPSATSAVTLSKCMSLVFISDGTDCWEIARSGLL